MSTGLNVREMLPSDVKRWLDYWINATPEHLVKMGVDILKRPTEEQLIDLISDQLENSYTSKKGYYLIWEYSEKAIGYSNINKIEYGNYAFMHLHLWDTSARQKGWGTKLVRKSLPFYFNNFKLKELYCEPYAQNSAPNRTLEKLGFDMVKTYTTIPGASNFEQSVNQWKLTYDCFVLY